jgi:hypothetical protein
VPGAALDRRGIQALGADRDAGRVLAGVQGGLDPQTAAGAGRRDGLDDPSWLVSGLPRQFMVLGEHSRCSSWFHVEVPGGNWQTVIAGPVSAARWPVRSSRHRSR